MIDNHCPKSESGPLDGPGHVSDLSLHLSRINSQYTYNHPPHITTIVRHTEREERGLDKSQDFARRRNSLMPLVTSGRYQ